MAKKKEKAEGADEQQKQSSSAPAAAEERPRKRQSQQQREAPEPAAAADEADEAPAPPQRKKQRPGGDDTAAAAPVAASSGGKGCGGKGGGKTGRPSFLKMLRPKSGRSYTVSVALPASIIENAQSGELKAILVGQVARALTIFSVDEAVLYEDHSAAPKSDDDESVSRGMAFFARNMQYLETPQYLRRQLLPMHRDLRWVGLLSPLDAPHHMRKTERLPYREGAVLGGSKCPADPEGAGPGCWVNCGLWDPVWLEGEKIPSGIRVTVRVDDKDPQRGSAVPPNEPTTRMGLYWGYQTRIASSLKAVFDECPYEGGYDLTVGTSERGEALGMMSRLPRFRHLLVVFGGVAGLEEAVEDELSGYPAGTDPASLFGRYLNICPAQTSRTIRTEEALLIALASLSPQMR